MPKINWTFLLFCVLALFGIQQCSSMPASTAFLADPETKSATPLILLYDSMPDRTAMQRLVSLNTDSWLQINQDAPSYKTGVIDIDEIGRQVQSRTGGNPGTWVMLDIEEPFFSDLAKDPKTPEFQRAQKSMIATIRAMKARWPQSKWTFYGIPNLPYWIDGKGWATATAEKKKEMLDKVAAASAPLVQECDWVSVSLYDVYDPKMIVPGSPNSIRGTPASVREDGQAWRMAEVGLAKLLGRGKPVIPNVCPFWVPGGIAPSCRLIQPRAFIEDQIAPAVKAGANGFALWTGMDYRIQIVTQDDAKAAATTAEKNFGVKDWRSAFSADYLKGWNPKNWNDPQVRQTLVTETSRMIINTLTNIRSWEKLGTLPAAGP